jgi:proteic killer suppression protein
VIRSFRRRDAEAIFNGDQVPRLAHIAKVARRRLRLLHNARFLGDLAALPGNHLEALKGDRAGQHSIRINDQFRVCFRWERDGASDVEIVDYH